MTGSRRSSRKGRAARATQASRRWYDAPRRWYDAPRPRWPILTTYRERKLQRIAFPLGGIGTGTVSLGGRGQLIDWEIVNRASKGYKPAHSFFALWVRDGAKPPVTRVLEGVLTPPYDGSTGAGPDAGLPRFRECVFHAAYPLAQVELSDPDVPVSVRLGAWNPLIPHDAERSGLPVAVLRYVLKNRTSRPLRASVCGSLENFIGFDGKDGAAQGNRNEFVQAKGLRGMLLRSDFVAPDSPQYGTLAIATTHDTVSFRARWARKRWNNDILAFWDDFSADGKLSDPGPPAADDKTSQHASLAAACTIPPRSEKTITFLLSWHFPNRTAQVCGWDTGNKENAGRVGNHYATRFGDAWAAAREVGAQLADLEAETLKFARAFCESSLPQAVKEAALNNLSTLRSQTCFRTADGNFYGFEGCHDKTGCCYGSCTHVWNYEHASGFLFPTLARAMRCVEFGPSTREDGLMSFRTRLPLREAPPSNMAAADGQMGTIMRLYREWQLSGEDEFLRVLWPKARKTMEFAWLAGSWDADQDGVMEGCQHNTYDVEFFGPNPMMGAMYLGALRAMEEMAKAMGEAAFAQRCRGLFEKGSRWIDANLWNGEYYIQKIQGLPPGEKPLAGLTVGMGTGDPGRPEFQVGNGCLVDQLLGQYMAHALGLGYVLNRNKVRKALESLFKHNFKRGMYDHWNTMRTYALNDESALLICTWPKGNRPEVPFPYFSEVMTGFEYQAAVHMIYEGLIEQGLEVIAAIRARYDGERRSPWDEAECGHHYARAMASWTALPALSGFVYHGARKALTIAPRIAGDDFRCFWSTGTGWGTLRQKGGSVEITVLHGVLAVSTLRLGALKPGARAAVRANGEAVRFSMEADTLKFPSPLLLRCGGTLTVAQKGKARR